MANYNSIHTGSVIDNVVSNALLKSEAASIYLMKSDAASTYLTQTDAVTLYPTKTGGGASGTWGISITGNCSGNSHTADLLNNIGGRIDSPSAMIADGKMRLFLSTSSMTTDSPPTGDGHILHFGWDNTGGWDNELAIGNGNRGGHLAIRGGTGNGDATNNTQTWTGWHIVLDDNNYGSYAVTLSTDQTNITGKKRFTQAVQCYRYTNANNLPAITIDKPGSNYVGIGADGTSNRIKFGPCSSLDGAAWIDQSTFNSNNWYFQGSMNVTSTATVSGIFYASSGIQSQHGHVFNVAGNEVNFIPDGYNATQWFNYESFGRTNNSTVSGYCMGNGKHGYTPVTASAHNTSSSRLIKENIEDMDDNNIFDILKDIRPVKFDYIDERFGGKNQFGFIAEEIEELIPSIVTDPPNNLPEEFLEPDKIEYKSLDYGKVTPFLVKGWQIQQKEIELLKEEIQQLKEMIRNG